MNMDMNNRFNLNIPLDGKDGEQIVEIPKEAIPPIETYATSGSFQGGGDSKFYLKFQWTQTKKTGASDIKVTMQLYTQYERYGNALSGTHITINGNKKSITANVSGSGSTTIGTHTVSVTHTAAMSVPISGALVWNGTYAGTYYGTISKSGSANIEAVTPPFPKIKIGGTYRTPKNVYVKIGGTYRAAKKIYVKVGGTYRATK